MINAKAPLILAKTSFQRQKIFDRVYQGLAFHDRMSSLPSLLSDTVTVNIVVSCLGSLVLRTDTAEELCCNKCSFILQVIIRSHWFHNRKEASEAPITCSTPGAVRHTKHTNHWKIGQDTFGTFGRAWIR